MQEAIDFILSVDVAKLAADPRIIGATIALAVVAVLMRWKFVLLIIFGVFAILAVARYANLAEAALDTQLFIFVGGAFAIGVVLIYFLFIRGD